MINLWNILSNDLSSNLAAFLSVTLRKNTRESELSETFKSHQKTDFFVVVPVQASPCWLSLCWCQQEWAYSRKCSTSSMENTPRRLSSTMWVVFFSPLGSNIPEAATLVSQPERKLNYRSRLVLNFRIPTQHCLPLPGFLLLSTDIYNHCVYFSQSSESLGSNLCRKCVVVEKIGVFLI